MPTTEGPSVSSQRVSQQLVQAETLHVEEPDQVEQDAEKIVIRPARYLTPVGRAVHPGNEARTDDPTAEQRT
jgi:hypothetical protein